MASDAGALVDKRRFVKIEDITAVVRTDSDMFVEMAETATRFLNGRVWCKSITQGYLDRGLAGIIAIFFFEYERTDGEEAPPSTWIIHGVLPLIVIPPYVAIDGMTALEEYLKVLEAWCDRVEFGLSILDLPPVHHPDGVSMVAMTADYARDLRKRVESLREMILPWLWDWTPDED